MNIKVDGYDIDVLVQGFPGRAVYHGGLGWSTVALVRAHGRAALVDAGGFGMRRLLVARLAERGLTPADITDLLLTHADWDHSVNWTLFRRARIVVGRRELEWAIEQPWGETPVPELYVQELARCPTLETVEDGEEAFPGITTHLAPGHTGGHVIFVLRGADRDVIFAGDAVKNRAELMSRHAHGTYDAAASAASIETVWDHWRRVPGSILIAGHDVPMVLEDGRCRYLGRREAAITAWYGEDLTTTMRFELTGRE